MQHLQPNTTLQGGKYRIERVLGQGGFGNTYLAEQVSLSRKVAIKEFFMKDLCGRGDDTRTVETPSTGSSRQVEMYRRKFIKEAHNLARLSHPNIISVIEVFEENSTVYYVMPYLSGGSLYDYVKNHGALSEDEAKRYIRQIAKALKYMHEDMHICHYDVKPSNILLDDKGNAILIDFGISKNYDTSGHETSTTPIGLSEGYAPIEQYQQNVAEFSPVSDVYALGATLYYLLHGKRPVNAPSRAAGTALYMNKNLSLNTKSLINATMKISKTERSQSMDVFIRGIVNPSSFEEKAFISGSSSNSNKQYSEETLQAGGSNIQHSTSKKEYAHVENSEKSYLGWIIGIAAIVLIGIVIFINNGNNNNIGPATDSYNTSAPTNEDTTYQNNEEINSSSVSETDIYAERVKAFSQKRKGIIASYPNDNRYCVYYSKPLDGHKELYRYDAITDKEEKMNLPIQATWGYTDLWLSKDERYIFIAAEERYSDFIRIDTETKQVMYITDCHHVARSSNGFIVTKAECYNEYEATCEADKLYEYTDYYYDEEGNYTGNHGNTYR